MKLRLCIRRSPWLLACLIAAGLSACDSDSGNGTQRTVTLPPPGRTSAYNPTTDTAPGDRRPTAPPADVTDEDMNGGGNSGITIPVPSGGEVMHAR